MTLSDLLRRGPLQRLQDAFSAISELPIRIRDADGEPLTRPSPPGQALGAPSHAAADITEVPVLVGGEVIGRVVFCNPPGTGPAETSPDPRATAALKLMADILGRLCDRQKELHSRVDELATLYHLTAEFTGQRDLQTVLDLVTRTVVEVVGAKACAIRLISEDGRELLIKAVANLSQEYLKKGAILIAESEIDRAVLADLKPVYVADQRSDPRVMYPAEARREGIVSALCAPLVFQGKPEGVLRVYMGEVHEFDWFAVSLLQAIAAQAAAAIVHARLDEEAATAWTMRRQLRLAGEVQRQMIPAHPPHIAGLDIAATYVPCFELAGDFYDFLDLPPDNTGIAVCDVVGKGVRASLLMASIRAALRAHAAYLYSMSEIVGNVNRSLCADTQIGDFATMFYGVIEAASRRFTYVNAGHLPPILVRSGQCCHLTTGGAVLGVEPTLQWNHDSFVLHPGDVILIYTDGLSEAMNFQDEAFGRQRVERALLEAVQDDLSAAGINRQVVWHMSRFAGLQSRLDDLTLVTIRAV